MSPEPQDHVILSLRGVAKSFDDFEALHQLDLDIRAGEFVTLLGPSGCGKTTLLRIIAGFERPSTGDLLLDGKSIIRFPPEQRPFNMVFQNYALFPHLNVFDNVAYGLRAAGVSESDIRRKVISALDIVGLGGHAARTIDQLSGGMSQRVALVRAIVGEPRILLLDEPLSALDLQLRKRMQIELRGIQERIRTTFIHVTHDQEEALMLSHRIVLMNKGRMEQQGSPRDLYHRPASRFVAEFIGETNFIPCVAENSLFDATQKGVGNRLVVRLPGGQTSDFPTYGNVAGYESKLLLSIRPQELQFRKTGLGLLDGVVIDRLFNGYADALVRIQDDLIVKVRSEESELPEVGTRIGLSPRLGKGALVY
jgi:spermidine/putrescine transport system ATP-binding protein